MRAFIGVLGMVAVLSSTACSQPYGYGGPGYGYAGPRYSYASPGYGYASPGYGYAGPGYGYAGPGYAYAPPPFAYGGIYGGNDGGRRDGWHGGERGRGWDRQRGRVGQPGGRLGNQQRRDAVNAELRARLPPPH
jgi:hypothetical protein